MTAVVIPNGMPTEAWFEWSSTQSFSIYNADAHRQLGSGSAPISFSGSALFSPGGVVWFRAVASNAMGINRSTIIQPIILGPR
jgi:hypothetical protein